MSTTDALASQRCRCGSGRSYKRCCLPLHEGRPAPSAEALMRSRYCAYALGRVDYIVQTTDPEGPQHRADLAAWREEIRVFCERTRFEGLSVEEASEQGDEGTVRFLARLSTGGRDASFGETSRFRRISGRWLYYGAEGPTRPRA